MKRFMPSLLVMFVVILFVTQLCAQTTSSRPGISVGVGGAAPPGMGMPDPSPQMDIKMRTVAWLGLQTREVSPEIHAHTDLPEGMGVVVEAIEPDSPAAKAGIARLTILTKFNDQLLVNSPQLDTLVRMRRPGEEVELTIFNKGRTQKVRIVLGKIEVPEDDIFGFQPGVIGISPVPMNYPMKAPMMPPDQMIDKPERPRMR
jgi:hypothetical protein